MNAAVAAPLANLPQSWPNNGVHLTRSGSLFVFGNKRRRLLKVLYWDGTGMWLMCKRLEEGTFFWPRAAQEGQSKLQLTPEAFAMLTDGIDMHGARPRGWYERG
jgi:transposase